MLMDYGCEIIENPFSRPYTQAELMKIVPDIDGVVAGVDTWDEAVLCKAKKLKAIARFGVGVDNIDLKYSREHGITVTNSPGINSNAVAEHTVGLMLNVLKGICSANEETHNCLWPRTMSHELGSCTVGFIGFGAVAYETARKLAGFSCKMIAYDKYPNSQRFENSGVELCTLDKVISESDIISLHTPLTPETQKMINSESISRMKDGVYIINTARGGLIDDEALLEAVKNGKIKGAAVDVFNMEPVDSNCLLLQDDRIILTPHIASETFENYELTSVRTAAALIDIFEGRMPADCLTCR
ncbi:MAG: phosphoglycerate dehydrogenase [Candidatus Limivicinus sp.]